MYAPHVQPYWFPNRDIFPAGADITAPTLVSASYLSLTVIRLVFDEAVTPVSGSSSGLTMVGPSAPTVTYTSGSGTTTLDYTMSRAITDDEKFDDVFTLSHTWVNIIDGAGNHLGDFSGVAITHEAEPGSEGDNDKRQKRHERMYRRALALGVRRLRRVRRR